LEVLAIDLVKKELGIPEGSVQYDARIIGMGEFNPEDFGHDEEEQGGEEEGGEEEMNFGNEIEIVNNLEDLNLEKAKRRFINTIIQGASKRGHYMYHYVEDRVREIVGNDRIIGLYGIMMSVNDALYWQLPDETMKSMGQAGAIAGREDVDRQTDPPTIKVRAVNFPIAVHECIKGWLELVATKGEKAGNALDQERYMQAKSMEDTIDKELWDLRLGPAIWDKVLERIPVELVTDKNTYGYQNFLLMEIFSLPAKKMLVLLKEVVAQTPVGDRLLNELIDAIKENMNQYQLV
jgi:hypothetical protein